jgi:phage terminase Nu1 subunit (DNA packaging protein)
MGLPPDVEAALAPPISPLGGTLSAAELADFLGITANRIHALARQGVIPRTAAGHFDFAPAVRAYCEHLRAGQLGRPTAHPELVAAKLRREMAAAEQIELKNAAARAELLPAVEVEREWRAVLANVRSALLAVPSRVGTRLPGLTAHEVAEIAAEVRAALERLSDDTA